jgi:hypothetical protein
VVSSPGPSVQGIIEGQTHNPFLGIFADPSNPIKVWSGTYTPKTSASLLVPVTATPATFSYYPSALTTSMVVTQADPGHTWLFVNPLLIQGVPVAPGKGTALGRGGSGDDVLIGGTTGFEPLLVGMLAPAVQKVRIHPTIPPLGLTIQTHYEESRAPFGPHLHGDGDCRFVQPPSQVVLSPTSTSTPSSFRDRPVRLRIAAVNNRGATIPLLPLTYGVEPSHDPINNDDFNHWRMKFGAAVPVIDPQGRLLIAESIDVWAIRHNSHGELTATTQTIEIRGHGHGGGGGAGKVSFQDLHF